MNNNDFNYYNNIKNNKVKLNNNNTIKLNNNNLEKKQTNMYDILFNTLDYFNPFNIEGLENSNNCPYQSVESINSEILNLRASGKTIDEQNTQLDEYSTLCSEQYGGVNSLINMSIIDIIKNEKQRNILLKGLNEKVFILDENLKKLFFMITPYMGTGVHPVDLFKQEFSLDISEIPSFGDCVNLCETNYNEIIQDYSNIYGEEPTAFKNGIRILLDCIKLLRINASVSLSVETQQFVYNDKKNWGNAMEALGLHNMTSDNNSYYADGKYHPLFKDHERQDHSREILVGIKEDLNNISEEINQVGSDLYKYVEYFTTNYPYINQDQANLFLQFPNGTTATDILKEGEDAIEETSGLLYRMFMLQETNRQSSHLREFVVNLRSLYFSLRNRTDFTTYDTDELKSFLNENKNNIEQVIDSYYDEGGKFRNILHLDKNEFKNLLSFGIPDSLKELCFNLSKVNDYTGETYASCPPDSLDIQYDADVFMKEGIKTINGRKLGIYQIPINTIFIYISRINRLYCRKIRDNFCDSIISEEQKQEMLAEYSDIRDILNTESDHASAYSISTSGNTTTASNPVISESFTNMKEGFQGNREMIDGKVKFSGSVSNILKDYTNTFGGEEQTLQNYTDDKINLSICNPVNTPYFSATYKCGNIVNDTPLSNLTNSDIAQFNCANPDNQTNDLFNCNLFYLILNDDGSMNIKRNNEVMFSWDPEIDETEKLFIIEGGMNESSLDPSNILYGGQTLNPGDFLSSPNKTFNLINDNGVLKLEYKITPCFRNNKNINHGYYGNDEGTHKSIGIYHVDDVNISHIGKAGHVNLNGELQLYQNPKFSNAYINVGNYTTSHHGNMSSKPTTDDQIISNNGTAVIYETTSPDTCAQYCDAYDNCGGYLISEGQCMLKSDKMFPVGLRVPNSSSNMYVRMKGFPQKDLHISTKAIKNENSNMHNFKLDEYNSSGNLLSGYREPKTPSDIVEASSLYYEEYNKTKQELINAKKDLNDTLRNLNAQEIELLKQYNINVDNMQQNITKQEQIQKDIYNKIDGINTLETAVYDVNTNVNQNLQYMFVYSALTIGFLGATFALI